jgi:thiol-disulfide isomerase/thioredoxin
MMSRRIVLAFAAVLPLAFASAASAEETFTNAALEAAQKAGKPVLVEIAAPWCPVCKAQKPILEGLAKNDKFKGFVFLKMDFDTQKDGVRKLNARSQSTLIVFKGTNEVGRSVGDTNPQSVEALLAKAL